MQRSITRAVRYGAVVLGSVAVLGVGASAASATSVRQGTTSSLPTSSSPLVATGTSIGSSSLVGNASFTSPTTSSGSCPTGALRGVLATNNVSGSLNVSSPVFTIGNPGSSTVNCTDNNPNFDLVSIELTSADDPIIIIITGSGPVIIITNPKFTVRIKSGGVVTACTGVSLLPGTTSVTGTVNNGTTTTGSTVPRVTFSGINAYYPGASSVCKAQLGDNSSSTQRSTFSATLGPLRVNPSTTTSSNFIGVFNP